METNIYDLMEKLSAFPQPRKHCFPQRLPFDRLHTFPQRLLLLLENERHHRKMMALILFLRILPQQDLVYSFFLSAHSAWSDKLRRLYGPHRIQRDCFASPSAGCEFEKRLLDGCWPLRRISRFHIIGFKVFHIVAQLPPWDMAVSKSRNCCHPEQVAAGV